MVTLENNLKTSNYVYVGANMVLELFYDALSTAVLYMMSLR
jgi:hypothetical protein